MFNSYPAKFILVLFLITIVYSCQKDLNWTDALNSRGDSTLIQKIISLDTTLPAGQDTVETSLYEYDMQDRLKRLTINFFPGFTPIDIYEYQYNGTDTLPYWYSAVNHGSADSISTFLSYSNGFIVKDSSRVFRASQLDQVFVSRYSAAGPNKYIYTLYVTDIASGNTYIIDSTRYTRIVNNGNVLSRADSTWRHGIFFNTKSCHQTFDNKNSPFSKKALWALGYFGNGFDLTLLEGTNNITLASEAYFNQPPVDFTYSYDYNSGNFPSVCRISSPGGTDINKMIFQYLP